MSSYKHIALTILKSLFPTVDMSRVDRLLATAATQLNQSVADVMQNLGADEASIVSVRTFQGAIPLKWKTAQAHCKAALFPTAWECYSDWYECRDGKKRQLDSMSPPVTPEKAKKVKA